MANNTNTTASATLQFGNVLPNIHTYESLSLFPAHGADGNLYIDTSDNTLYRWDGTGYAAVGAIGSGVEAVEVLPQEGADGRFYIANGSLYAWNADRHDYDVLIVGATTPAGLITATVRNGDHPEVVMGPNTLTLTKPETKILVTDITTRIVGGVLDELYGVEHAFMEVYNEDKMIQMSDVSLRWVDGTLEMGLDLSECKNVNGNYGKLKLTLAGLTSKIVCTLDLGWFCCSDESNGTKIDITDMKAVISAASTAAGRRSWDLPDKDAAALQELIREKGLPESYEIKNEVFLEKNSDIAPGKLLIADLSATDHLFFKGKKDRLEEVVVRNCPWLDVEIGIEKLALLDVDALSPYCKTVADKKYIGDLRIANWRDSGWCYTIDESGTVGVEYREQSEDCELANRILDAGTASVSGTLCISANKITHYKRLKTMEKAGGGLYVETNGWWDDGGAIEPCLTRISGCHYMTEAGRNYTYYVNRDSHCHYRTAGLEWRFSGMDGSVITDEAHPGGFRVTDYIELVGQDDTEGTVTLRLKKALEPGMASFAIELAAAYGGVFNPKFYTTFKIFPFAPLPLSGGFVDMEGNYAEAPDGSEADGATEYDCRYPYFWYNSAAPRLYRVLDVREGGLHATLEGSGKQLRSGLFWNGTGKSFALDIPVVASGHESPFIDLGADYANLPTTIPDGNGGTVPVDTNIVQAAKKYLEEYRDDDKYGENIFPVGAVNTAYMLATYGLAYGDGIRPEMPGFDSLFAEKTKNNVSGNNKTDEEKKKTGDATEEEMTEQGKQQDKDEEDKKKAPTYAAAAAAYLYRQAWSGAYDYAAIPLMWLPAAGEAHCTGTSMVTSEVADPFDTAAQWHDPENKVTHYAIANAMTGNTDFCAMDSAVDTSGFVPVFWIASDMEGRRSAMGVTETPL